jgi:hypothetical protein
VATPREWSLAAALMRLLLGFALEGKDQLGSRLREWDRASASASAPTGTATAPDLRRYTTLGMLMEAQERAGALVQALWDVSDEMAARLGGGASFLLQRWPFQLLRPRLLGLRRDFEEALDEWAALGRHEEEYGRRMARQAASSLVDELLDYLARNPEVRELIERQSASLAETAVDGVRERAASADALVERLVHGLLRRPVDAQTPTPHNGSPGSPQPVDRAG